MIRDPHPCGVCGKELRIWNMGGLTKKGPCCIECLKITEKDMRL